MQTTTRHDTPANTAALLTPRSIKQPLTPPASRSTIATHAAFLLARDDDGRAR